MVSVIQNAPVKEIATSNKDIYIGIFAVIVGVTLFIGGIGLLIAWVSRKINDSQRKHNDLLFRKFNTEIEHANINKDGRFKKRNWKTLWITWSRSNVFANTENGLRSIGKYDGELLKKEEFILISFKISKNFFTKLNYIIVIPYELRNIIIKNTDRKNEIWINCEGLDEVTNTDFYMIPILKDLTNNDKFIDFSNRVFSEFVETYVYKDIIKENLLKYRDSIKESTELNPNIQVGRKNPNKNL